jgi:hypothetical protein
MDRERVVEALDWRRTPPPDWTYVGTGVLRCGSCGDLLTGENALDEVTNRRTSDDYYCPNDATICSRVRAPAHAVARELQALAEERWTDPEFVRCRRQKHLAALDIEIADAEGILEWCSDRRRRNQVVRRIGRYRGKRRLEFGLSDLSRRLPGLAAERAALAAVLAGKQEPDGMTYPSELLKAFSSDWGTSLTTQTARRRKLVVLAVEGDLLVVDPAVEAEPYVRKVTS